ncbi:MAG: DUF547 domain-containing protein [Deltaproteobacteria bacterium]|nr:DUF547 domain-containing protein [Deltaproteobacteria bacterium]
MNRPNRRYLAGLIFLLIQGLVSWESSARLYGELLQKYVSNGVVDYQGFKKEEAKLDGYLRVLENTDLKVLSQKEQFAFFVNAYNSWTIKLILSKYPSIKSIKDLGSLFKSPWQKKIVRITGEVLTLDNIEHDILRPRFKDPRIHFAVNCASKGCPPLMSEPFRGEVLDQQLTDMTERFINAPLRNRLEGKILYVNPIFKWYSEDFNKDIVGFFIRYAKGDLKERLVRNQKEIKIEYLDYDWSLNGR